MMFLKNYTSDVPVAQTIYRIEQVLIKCGVSGITKEYSPTGGVWALRFHLKLADSQELTIRLPADKDRALEALWLNYADGDELSHDGQRLAWNSYKKKTKKDFEAQAERTAWKIMQDWVEVQMSLIQLRQAEPIEVFLPYVWNGSETFYHKLKSSGYRALLPENPPPY